jgi:hypothetical protein
MDFCQAGARQGEDKAEAGGGGEGLVRIILFHMTGLGGIQKGHKSSENTKKMDFYQAGARQGGDEAKAGGGGEGLPGEEAGVCQIHYPV